MLQIGEVGRECKWWERESGMCFKSRSTLVDFERWFRSTQSIFGYHKWPYQHRDILSQCKQSNRHRGYFRKDVCFQQLFWRYNFDSINTEVHHIKYHKIFIQICTFLGDWSIFITLGLFLIDLPRDLIRLNHKMTVLVLWIS